MLSYSQNTDSVILMADFCRISNSSALENFLRLILRETCVSESDVYV